MTRRILVSGLCAVLGIAAYAAAQNATLRTADGKPDLQGTWSFATLTPIERPADLGDKEFFTEQEAAAWVKQQISQGNMDRRDGTAAQDVGRAYNDFWWDRVTSIVKTRRTSLVIDPRNGKIPPMLPEAQKRIAALPRGGSSFSNGVYDSYESLSLYDRCITRGYPSSMLPAIYGDSYQIIQGPGFVAIRIEMIHETRVIPLGGQPHANKGIALDMGDPRGHWEGSTLVVETTNFRERSIYRNGNPKTFKLIERFTPTSKKSLEWSVTVDDSSTWTRPWTFSLPLTVNDDEPLYEYGCHEGNYAIKNILTGSRLADAEASKAVAK